MVILSLILVVAFLVIDQIIKFFIISNVDIGSVFNTFSIGGKDLISIIHVRNTGAAWSIFQGKTVFLIIIAIIAVILVLYLIASNKFSSKFEVIMLSLVMAGGLGNLVDRIRLKEVVDYIKLDFMDFPIFNFADICVVVGAIGFCISYIIIDTIKNKKQTDKIEDKVNTEEK